MATSTLDETAGMTAARLANKRIRRSENIAGWSFAGPSVIIVLGLSFVPMIWAGYLSLTNSDLVSGLKHRTEALRLRAILIGRGALWRRPKPDREDWWTNHKCECRYK
jgi:hypothetical protein